MPDLRALTESEAINAITAAGLTVGTRSEAFDPAIPIGAIADQEPGANIVVAPAIARELHRVQGPRAHAQPDAHPDAHAHAHAHPDADPNAHPDPPPDPDPDAGPRNVGDYVCLTLEVATTQIDDDGFTVGDVTTRPAGHGPGPARLDRRPTSSRTRARTGTSARRSTSCSPSRRRWPTVR